jgi:hypothetical protein
MSVHIAQSALPTAQDFLKVTQEVSQLEETISTSEQFSRTWLPRGDEKNTDASLSGGRPGKEQTPFLNSPAGVGLAEDGTKACDLETTLLR